jgi:hypothetical protein
MIPTAEQKEKRRRQKEDEQTFADSPDFEDPGEKAWPMQHVQSVPRTPTAASQPFTPRTLAFQTLDRKLPLRHN